MGSSARLCPGCPSCPNVRAEPSCPKESRAVRYCPTVRACPTVFGGFVRPKAEPRRFCPKPSSAVQLSNVRMPTPVCRRLVDLALRRFFNQSSFDMRWRSIKNHGRFLVYLYLPKRDDKFYFNSHLSLRRKRTARRYSTLILLDDLADATSQKLGVLVRS